MRLLHTFKSKPTAKHFGLYLESKGIEHQIRNDKKGHGLWILDDLKLAAARSHLDTFQSNPASAVDLKQQIQTISAREKQQLKDLHKHYRKHFPRLGSCHITPTLIIISVLVYVAQQINPSGIIELSLFILPTDITPKTLWITEPWRLLTPMFLHFGLIHLIFNMLAMYDLGVVIEKKESRRFFVALIITTSLVSSLLQLMFAGPYFGGMSGVLFGLFGYIWISSKYNFNAGYHMPNETVVLALGWFVLCWTGALGPIANWGHLGGLLTGMLFAYLKKRK